MKKYFMYLMVYSVGGFFLERIINFVVFLEEFDRYDSIIDYIISYDNSVLYGPYQPLYGFGILFPIIIWDCFLSKDSNIVRRNVILVVIAIVFTALSEIIHGYGYEFLTGDILWDYGEYYTCRIPYACFIPTSMFGIFSYLVIKFIHPFVKMIVSMLPKLAVYLILVLFATDIVLTYFLKIA